MLHATIAGTGRAVPDQILTNADLEKMVETSDEWITSRTGIRERRMAAEGDVLSDFCVARGATPALEAAGLAREGPRHDHPRDLHARPADPRRGPRHPAQARREEGGGVRPERGVLGLALRAPRRRRPRSGGEGEEHPPPRRRVPDALRGLHRPGHLRPVRRRRRRDGPQGHVLRPRRPRDRDPHGRRGRVLHLDAGRRVDVPAEPARDARGAPPVHPDEGRRHVQGRHPRRWSRSARRSSPRADSRRTTSRGSSRTRRTSGSSRRTADRLKIPAERCMNNIARYGNTSSASIPIALDEYARDGPHQAGRPHPHHGLRRRTDLGGRRSSAGERRERVSRSSSPARGRSSPGWGRTSPFASPRRATFTRARTRRSRPLGLVVSKVSFEGTDEDLRQTAVTQPAILTHAVAVLAVLKAKGIVPSVAAGHSLGEYAALVAAGALTLEDAVVLVRRRGTFMQEAVPAGQGAMSAVIGLAPEDGRRRRAPRRPRPPARSSRPRTSTRPSRP